MKKKRGPRLAAGSKHLVKGADLSTLGNPFTRGNWVKASVETLLFLLRSRKLEKDMRADDSPVICKAPVTRLGLYYFRTNSA
jgi:hypothetical protein